MLDDIDTRLLLATTLLQQHPVLSISYTPTIDVVIIHIASTLRFSDLRRASSNVCGLRYRDRPDSPTFAELLRTCVDYAIVTDHGRSPITEDATAR
jgi:hypothetical protein